MKVLFLEFYLYVDIFWIPLYSKLYTKWIYDNRDCFEKNKLEPDRLNEKKERFILILFKHDPLYNVSQGKEEYHDSISDWTFLYLLNHPIVHTFIDLM